MTDYTDHGDSGMTYCHKCQGVYPFGESHTCPTILYHDGRDQPPKTDKPKAQNPPTGWRQQAYDDPRDKTQPSDLELKIRKEVMETVNKLDAELFKMQTIENVKYMEIIKDRLNLLWGE